MDYVNVNLAHSIDNSYKISIGANFELDFGNKKVCIVTNPTIAGLHLNTLLPKITADKIIITTIPDGEQYKNIQSVELILESLFNAKFDRKDVLIAFGGGVIGDIVGFSASMYQRGIDFVQVPTTLLSCIDSSVGGKTGINNKFGKNLIGAFWQPKGVYIDPNMLKTLPQKEFAAGMAEAIKKAVMFDKEFFDFLFNAKPQNSEQDLIAIIKKCVEIKAGVVEQDEKEQGLRAVLNYGHTFGHVIENETNYKGYLHGEAVAIGMVMANKLAVLMRYLTKDEEQKIKDLILKYNLPINYEIKSIESFYQKFFLDKKTSASKLTFILPKGIGGNKIEKDASKELILKALSEI